MTVPLHDTRAWWQRERGPLSIGPPIPEGVVPDGLTLYAHELRPSMQGTTCMGARAMSSPEKSTDLARALYLAYPGPSKAKRLAFEMGCSLATAKNLLNGIIPASLERFLRVTEKRPAILEHIIKNDWLAKLSLTREMSNVRSRLEEMERKFAKTTVRDGLGTDQDR